MNQGPLLSAVVYSLSYSLVWLLPPTRVRSPSALRVVSYIRCAVVGERLLSSGRAALATGSSLGLEFFRLSALGLGWLEATSYGALRLSDSVLVASQLATPWRGYWGNWGFFCSAPQDFVVLGVFCARFPPREANILLNIRTVDHKKS